MITGEQLSIAISAVLLIAVAVGWLLHWLWVKLSKAPGSPSKGMTDIADRMHEADQARERAEEALAKAQGQFSEREAELSAELETMRNDFSASNSAREQELAAALSEAKVDSETYKDGLRNARERIAELEAEVEELRRRAEG